MDNPTLNRFNLTVITQQEFIAKLHMITAIGGSIQSGSYRVEPGAIAFKVLMTQGQMATFQLIRQIPNCEAQFARTHALVTALGGHIKAGSLTYSNGRMNPTIVLSEEARQTYRMLQKMP